MRQEQGQHEADCNPLDPRVPTPCEQPVAHAIEIKHESAAEQQGNDRFGDLDGPLADKARNGEEVEQQGEVDGEEQEYDRLASRRPGRRRDFQRTTPLLAYQFA